MESVQFEIPIQVPSLNKMLRTHAAERLRVQEVWDMHVYSHWLAHGRKVFMNPVRVHFILVFEADRRRDYDNYYGGTKYAIDALKRSFLLRDDYKVLRGLSVAFDFGERAKTIIQIVEDMEILDQGGNDDV